jgi:tetratricopeptide (TPR) repeat protein
MRRSSRGSKSIKAGRNIEIASTGDNAINVVARFQFGSDSYPDVPPTAMHLPPQIAGFTGRERELTEVVRLLDPSAATKVPVSAVAGPPGVGKTALAIQAGHVARDRDWFPAGTFFIDLHGYDDAPIEPLQALGTLLRALGLATERIPPEIDERMRLYASVLAGQSAPLLLIADNASSEAQVRPLLPSAGPHRMLVTSQQTLAGLSAQLIDIDVLGTPASVELLDAAVRIGRPDDQRVTLNHETAARLAAACDGLPLALQIVAALLKADPTRTVGELADEVTDERGRLDRLRYDDGSGSTAPSVQAAFSLSYRRLDETSAWVFQVLPVNPGPNVATAAAAALVDLPVAQARDVLAGLAAAHLVETVGTGRWGMHDLIRVFANRVAESCALRDKKESARDRLLAFYVRHVFAALKHLGDPVDEPMPEDFASQQEALAWLEAERLNLLAAAKTAAASGQDGYACGLALGLGRFLSMCRRFDDWLAISEIGVAAASQLGDRALEVRAIHHLGLAQRSTRHFEEALTTFRRAQSIYRNAGDRSGEGATLRDLGQALAEMRRFEDAISTFQAAAAIYRETGNLSEEGVVLICVGGTLAQMRNFEEAVTSYRTAAALSRQAGDRDGEARALVELGTTLVETGQLDEAVETAYRAAEIYRKLGDRKGEREALDNVAFVLRQLPSIKQGAIALYMHSVADYQRSGDRHGEAAALSKLGLAMAEVRKFKMQAVVAHRQAVQIFREVDDRHSEGEVLVNLGSALNGVRRFGEAISVFRQAQAIFRETNDRRNEGAALNNLVEALIGLRRYDEAITVCRQAEAIFREANDPYGQSMALRNLGIVMDRLRRFEEATTAFRQAEAICREIGYRRGERIAQLGLARVRTGKKLRKIKFWAGPDFT